mmetsp:Transcript_2915/g.5138  ORF Transcript_2915/g.5138 Transcript_2915/m.5138 type:complete len:86 (+) Transcript_2915:335-592(+)
MRGSKHWWLGFVAHKFLNLLDLGFNYLVVQYKAMQSPPSRTGANAMQPAMSRVCYQVLKFRERNNNHHSMYEINATQLQQGRSRK